MLTEGDKAADCADKLDGKSRCGHWSARREFYVALPLDYDRDRQRAPALVIHGGACESSAGGDFLKTASELIKVGIAPGPNTTGDPVNPGEKCFDIREGDDSIDWVFYEQLYDKLNAELCFDRRRVFIGGFSTFANELACKYAGDAVRPVRGLLSDSGGLLEDPISVSPTSTVSQPQVFKLFCARSARDH